MTATAPLDIGARTLRCKTLGDVTGVQFRGVVSALCALRTREYTPDSVVLNMTLTDRDGAAMRLFLFDAWARALSFVADGDAVVLVGAMRLFANPEAPAEALLGTTAASTVVVEQAAELGDVMELVVTPATFDNPVARVKKDKRPVVVPHDPVGGRTDAYGRRVMPEPDA